MADEQVLDMIYVENENRNDLDPYRRAQVIAKRMERWDPDEDGATTSRSSPWVVRPRSSS